MKLTKQQTLLEAMCVDISIRFSRPPAPKGRKDSARGFNPGLPTENAAPCRGGREFLTDYAVTEKNRKGYFRPFRAAGPLIVYPGLKPRAESFRPVGANTAPPLDKP
jgi:hypothetical protein